MTTEVSADDLFYSVAEKNEKKVKNRQFSYGKSQDDEIKKSAQNEINVIGQTVDEAIANIDAFIDAAVLASYGKIWIIHGMGTGRLRAGIHQYLKHHPNVKDFRLGVYGEGESGVTVVTLK